MQEQCVNVIKTAVLQQTYLKNGYPTVHGWVFDLKTGLLKDLKLDFEHILHNIQEIYNLGDQPIFGEGGTPAEEIGKVAKTEEER